MAPKDWRVCWFFSTLIALFITNFAPHYAVNLTSLYGAMFVINSATLKTQQNKWFQRTGGCASTSAGSSIPAWKKDVRVSYFSSPTLLLWMDVSSSKGSLKSPDIQAHVCVLLVAGREMSLTTRAKSELPQAGIEPQTCGCFVCSV